MQTIKLHIKSISDVKFIVNKQQMYSYAVRKIYKHMDKVEDKVFIEFICNKFNLNDIEYRSILSQAKIKLAQVQTNKIEKEEKIMLLYKEINELRKDDKNRIRIKFKAHNNLKKEERNLSKDIVFGTKAVLQKLSYLNNYKTEKAEEIKSEKIKFSNNRLYPFFLIGEANQNGNRFFDFDLKNKKIIYKPKRGKRIEILFANYSTYKNILLKLQKMIDDRRLSISVMMTSSSINLIFDDELLHGYAVDEKSRKEAVKRIKLEHIDKNVQKKLIKETYVKFFNEQKEKKLWGKIKNRYLSIDLNPYYIGCSVLDCIGDEIKVIATFYYDLSAAGKRLPKTASEEHRRHINNKRVHGITHIWKDVFETFSYYNCGHLVIEELNLKNKILETKEANRQTKNIWHRTLTTNLINKYCNKLGIDKIEINPCYSSLIGNTQYNFFTDPVNASIEIGRRGIGKYIKDKFYPQIDVGTITDTMIRLNPSGDVPCLKDCKSWVDINTKIKESGLRYRATLFDNKNPNKMVLNLIHSNIIKIVFSPKNLHLCA